MKTTKNRNRVHRGEPGCREMIKLVDGKPIIPVPPDSPPPSLFSPQDKIAHWRLAFILALKEEISQKNGLRRDIINEFLERYNSGIPLPEIFKNLRKVSWQTLYRWMKAFNDYGIDGLVPQYGGEGNSKVTDHEKNFLLTVLLHPHSLKVAYAIKLLKNHFKSVGLESPSSPRTLRRYTDEFEKEHYDIWVLRREGEKALTDKVLPYAERDWRLLEVGEGLVADGHRLNFQIKHPVTGQKCRAALVLFWDWRSSYPLGWEIMVEENIQCVASALRNSILTLGKIPKWVLLDNGKAFRAKIFTEDISFEDTELPGMFARLNINYHFAQPYNAQAKPIERIFGILNEQLERLVPSYTGASIEDKPAWTKRNEKYARSLHNPFIPTIPETNDLVFAWRDRYAETPSRGRDGLRPLDIFNEGKGVGVDPGELTYLMMACEIKNVHRNGVTWLGWYWYDENLYGLKDKVVIRYSLSDLSQIYVFHKNEFLCAAKPIEKVNPMASESENPRDMEAVKEVLRLKKKVKNTTRKLCDLLDSKAAGQIDWSKTKNAEISETIKQREDKKPKAVNISPFVDDEEGKGAISVPARADAVPSIVEQAESSFDEWYKKYDYLMKKPALTVEDREWIDWYMTTSEYRSIYCQEPRPILGGG